MSEIRKVRRDGKVAVLVSSGFGAGWFTWHDCEELLFDPVVVELVEQWSKDPHSYQYSAQIEEYCLRVYGEDIYLGGIDGLYVVWVNEGEEFFIEEYDGAENIKLKSDIGWSVA